MGCPGASQAGGGLGAGLAAAAGSAGGADFSRDGYSYPDEASGLDPEGS
ncbi:hypothetical protein L829_2040 [Mycobacteroides abscessus MAB_030201_1075]|uniref:Uncharacterized protein n=1 Tax=Mycobacteroides abscessus MAB_030201_1075 TaxID=1335410 RepID=A0A829PN33_9MYCO|nr:hypothetical protein MA4S0206_0618 [Mycobacteroides abscessus 4S-0206]ETZ71105.1 hypothetical protein L835_4031 [Mycobacteroides abscessus MAB_110811_1470]ETZ88481.1 hypothetical protein L829_2040 [Mycobacteroides abscessus MAB_030201_1075]